MHCPWRVLSQPISSAAGHNEREREGRARVSALVGVTCGGMASFAGVHLHHVARETDDVERLVKFYQEVFGFEKIETPDFGLKVVWLRLPPSYALHIIQRDTKTCLPESPFSAVELARKEESALPNGHHLCFSITDYPGAIQVLKEKKIPYFEKFLLGGKVRQVFFFDPDGNGLELADWPPETHQLAC